MANPWFRVWSDMANDPKWRTIARVSKQSIGNVIATYLHMLTCGSNASSRGVIEGWCDEDVATALDIETDQVEAIRVAMQGRVLDENLLLGWCKRQPVREDETAAARAQAARDRKKIAQNEMEVTHRHAESHNASTDKIRGEEIREELNTLVPGDAEDASIDRPAKPDCPHQDIIALYHEMLPQCPQVRDWTAARATQLRARWNESADRQNLDYWRNLFGYVETCDFLVGRSPKPFFVDLEWITKSSNFTKIREGKYENRP